MDTESPSSTPSDKKLSPKKRSYKKKSETAPSSEVAKGGESESKASHVQKAPVHNLATHNKVSSQREDTISTFIILFICIFFLLFVSVQTYMQKKTGAQNTDFPVGIPSSIEKYPCSDHDNDFDTCVKVQQEGKGCSWYADCRKCIVGSHDGKTYEDICGNPRP